MKNNFWSPFIAVIFGILSVIALYYLGVFPKPESVIISQYPEYNNLVLNNVDGWNEIVIVGSEGKINTDITSENNLDGVKKWYQANTSDDLIADAFLYFEGQVDNDNPLDFTRDGFYFKISGDDEKGGYLVPGNTLPTPISTRRTRLLFDLENISYYKDHTKSELVSSENLLNYLNIYTQHGSDYPFKVSITAFIGSQKPPTTMKRVSIFYRYTEETSADAGLIEVEAAKGY